MRTYVGSVDPVDGRLSVIITDSPDPPPVVEMLALLEDLAEASDLTHLGRPSPEPERRDRLLQYKLQFLEASRTIGGRLRARRLPHLFVHSPDGFAWGYRGNGPADLALAILYRELAETVPAAVYPPFRDDVIARLPLDRFNLPATDIWHWVRAHRGLVDHHVFGATASPPDGASPESPPRSAGLSL
jgi:hypothetical protein